MKNKSLFLLYCLLIIHLRTGAQDSRTLKLDEAIQLSLQNCVQLKNDGARIEEAEAIFQQAKNRQLPNASVSGSYMGLSSANVKLNSNGSGDSPNVSQIIYGIVNVSLPIYAGGRIKYGIESSNLLKKAVELDGENDREGVIQNTIEAFANLYKAGTTIYLFEENIKQASQRINDLTNLEKNGLLSRNDLLKAQLQSSNLELSLLDAQNNFDLATINMDLMLGLPINTKLQPDTTGIYRKEDKRMLEDFVNAAKANRNDLQALDYRKQAAMIGVKAANGEKYPSVQLSGGYIAADVPGFLSITNAMNLGVGISYNIASLWKTKSVVKEAEAKVKQLNFTEADMMDKITLQVSKNYLSLISNRKKIDVNLKAVEQASENYRIIKNKFDNNLATLSDLLEADVALLQSRMAYNLSRADAYVSYNKLLLSSGLLSDNFKTNND